MTDDKRKKKERVVYIISFISDYIFHKINHHYNN